MKHVEEEQLALYAWGDLPSWESSAIASHLQNCGPCRKVVSEFQEARSFVAASLQNPQADELSEVRTRLLEELQPHQGSARPWAWWGAGIAAALALLALLPHTVEQRPIAIQKIELATLAANIEPGPALQIPPLTPVMVSRPKRLRSQKPGIRSVTLISQADREPVVRMTTADPNVVILWQLNERTEQEP